MSAELLFHAEFLDDIEKVRVAAKNRICALSHEMKHTTQAESGTYADRIIKDPDSAPTALRPYIDQHNALAEIEHQSVLQLKRALRAHPLGPWVKRTRGIGEKQGARLLAALGDPDWNAAEDRPRRGPSELHAYCGFAPDQKRRKGVTSNWNATAKKRARLCAEAAVKAGVRKVAGADCDDDEEYDVHAREAITPYGAEYLRARKKWADRDTNGRHKHAHALRVVAKEILKDLWVEARDIREAA